MTNRIFVAADVLLLLIAGWLGLLLYRTWTAPPVTSVAPAPARIRVAGTGAPASAPPASPKGTGAAAPLSAFAVVAERNLFNPARTENVPDPPKPAAPIAPTAPIAPAPPPPPRPRLYGVVIGAAGGTRAYLEDPRTRRVFGYAVGDSVAESQVADIQSDRVVMRRGSEVFEVLLRDPTKPRPPPSPVIPPAPAQPMFPFAPAPGQPGATPFQPVTPGVTPFGQPGGVPFQSGFGAQPFGQPGGVPFQTPAPGTQPFGQPASPFQPVPGTLAPGQPGIFQPAAPGPAAPPTRQRRSSLASPGLFVPGPPQGEQPQDGEPDS